MNPPVPGVDASRKVNGETTCALPVVRTIWFSVTLRAASVAGSTWTWSCWSRRPQMDTLATPGTPISCGRTVQRANTDCSIGLSSVEVRPIIRTRLDDESGGNKVGGRETLGSA